MLASTLIMSPIIAWVSIRFVEKKLDGVGMGTESELGDEDRFEIHLNDSESRAMKMAALSLAALVAILFIMGMKGLPFAPPDGKSFAYSPMLKCIPAVILFVFAVPGYVSVSYTHLYLPGQRDRR